MKKIVSFLLTLALLLSLGVPALAEEERDALYEKGMALFLDENYDEAYEALKEAAEKGHAGAAFGLAMCYTAGVGVEKDESAALALLLLSRLNGYGKDEMAAWLTQYAEEGSAVVQYLAGYLYSKGSAVFEQDDEKAFRYTQMAADQHYLDAILQLGEFYYNGTAVEPDKKMAASLFQSALEQDADNVVAKYALGLCYIDKDEDLLTERKGVKLLKEAADQGLSDATYALAVYYDDKQEKEAFDWAMKAADMGVPQAMYLLGLMYSTGIVVKLDLKEADRWFAKAAEAGLKF